MSKPIGVSEYKVTSELPEALSKQIPSVEDIQKHIKRDYNIEKLPDSISVYGERTARSLEYGEQYLLRPETGSDFASRRIPVGI